MHSMEECFNNTLEKNFWYLCLLFLKAGRVPFFSGWFCRLRKISSTEKKCSSNKLDLYYQGAFPVAKMELCSTSLWGRSHTQFHNTSVSNKSIFIMYPLEKYYYECSNKIFLIKFIKNIAGAWICCLPRNEEQEVWASTGTQGASKSKRRTCLNLAH